MPADEWGLVWQILGTESHCHYAQGTLCAVHTMQQADLFCLPLPQNHSFATYLALYHAAGLAMHTAAHQQCSQI